MVLSTEWSQVEVIDLINDGSGLGFGIVGGRSTGVVIKSILPGGIADKDNRLQSGDHILQIGDVNLRGLAADQVATVLRQSGPQVRMVVARPVEPSSSDFQHIDCSAPIVPTKILTDPEELDRQLQQNGYTSFFRSTTTTQLVNDGCKSNEFEITTQTVKLSKSLDIGCITNNNNNHHINNNNNNNFPISPIKNLYSTSLNPIVTNNSGVITFNDLKEDYETLPETERIEIELNKNEYGLGITIAGYVCEREDLCGIFVKGLNEGSEAYRCGRIRINDRIIEVDGQSLHGLTNYQAVDKLKRTEHTVRLIFERYLRGPKYEHLQEALAIQQQNDISPPSPSVTTLSWIPIESYEQQIEIEGESVASVNSEIYEQNPENKEIFIEEDFEVNLEDDLETATRTKWENLIGEKSQIIVANLTKLKGLGISLEGTVDVEDGVELRPRHYIRSILPEGPVGQNGKLCSGDELLEVNGQKLLGIKHVDVVKILRELPNTVRLVCARQHDENRGIINTSQDREAFEARNILGGSLKNLLPQPEQRLLKALSDTSINTSTSTVTITDDQQQSQEQQQQQPQSIGGGGVLEKSKSRSLEITNVAMWSDIVEYIDLIKTDRGLGFSILDYQDPLNMQLTVIVVRSLIPNGAAELDGRLTPGDRLISVNGKIIKNATLDQAVQALKGTLPGAVRLGISKPLTNHKTNQTANIN